MTKFNKILIFSLLEALTIGLLWDFLFDKGLIVQAALATFLLIAVEHVFARNTADGEPLCFALFHRFPSQAVLGLTEMIFWTTWRLIHERFEHIEAIGPVVAVIVFAVLMTPQHNLEANVNSNKPFFRQPFRSQGVAISVIEAVSALAWILTDDLGSGHRILALVPLFVGLAVEHAVREFGEPHGANF